MYFPVAGIEVNPLVPPAVAFVISFFTSMGGVSGAFLILPFQISVFGFTSPSVSATNQLYNIVAIPSGVYRYIREGRMVWPLAWIVVLGTLPGVLVGVILRISFFPDPKNFKFFVGLVLLYIGGKLLTDLIKKNRSKKISLPADFPRTVSRKFGLYRIIYDFNGETYDVSSIGIMALSLIVGIVGGVYGIGGGSIMAPFFVTLFELPVYTIAGAALMGTFVTSVVCVIFYQVIAPYYPNMVIAPDWILGLLFGVGGFAGMYFGARFQKYVPARLIKWLLFFCILFPAIKYIWGFFAPFN